jgi:hypothetical protein
VGRETLVNLLMALRHLSPQGLGVAAPDRMFSVLSNSDVRRKNWALPRSDGMEMSCLSN